MRTLLPALALLVLPACATEVAPPATPPAAPPAEDACGAEALQYLVGQPQSALAAMTFPDTTRFIGPGMAVTQDYRADRLNISYDEQGVITRVYCG